MDIRATLTLEIFDEMGKRSRVYERSESSGGGGNPDFIGAEAREPIRLVVEQILDSLQHPRPEWDPSLWREIEHVVKPGEEARYLREPAFRAAAERRARLNLSGLRDHTLSEAKQGGQ